MANSGPDKHQQNYPEDYFAKKAGLRFPISLALYSKSRLTNQGLAKIVSIESLFSLLFNLEKLPDGQVNCVRKLQYISQKARFSRCGRYRYSLRRRWSTGGGTVLFIGLNPSTADQQRDDPTIRRCVAFANFWGFNAMEIVNLFAFRATYPSDLKKSIDPIGHDNDRWINTAFGRSDLAVACWGNEGVFMDRGHQIMRKYAGLSCLKLNQTHQPAHPLYLKADLLPTPLLKLLE